jgi:hypothetical protein
VPWLGIVRNIILLHTHIILPQHLNNIFSLHTTSHLTHSEKLSLHQRQLTRSNSWTLDNRMLGGPVADVTPLARLETLARPHIISPQLLLSLRSVKTCSTQARVVKRYKPINRLGPGGSEAKKTPVTQACYGQRKFLSVKVKCGPTWNSTGRCVCSNGTVSTDT